MVDIDYQGTELLELLQEAENYNQYLLDELESFSTPGATLLDFGAGIGLFSSGMRRLGRDVACLEVDAKQRERLSADGFPVISQLPPTAEFSQVFSLNVLEHIEDDLATLKDIRACLKPGGRIFLYVPAMQILYSSFDKKVGHFRRYSRKDLEHKLRSAGFVIERLEFVDSLGFLAALVYRLLDRGDASMSAVSLKLFDRLVFPLSRFLDAVFKHVAGKNLLAIARKD